MEIFPLLDKALVDLENRDASFSKQPRVWPSEASAELLDQSYSKIVGKCHRASFHRLIGTQQSRKMDAIGGRKVEMGRAMEKHMGELAKAAGIFVASGVRYFIDDLTMSFEIDLVLRDPETKRLCIAENKTIDGYFSNSKIIKNGEPKVEGLMQETIYLNELSTGAALKAAIKTCWNKREATLQQIQGLMEQPDFKDDNPNYVRLLKEYERNRIEVDWKLFEDSDDGPLCGKLCYETRDTCETREFDVALKFDKDHQVHFATVDGMPNKTFAVESIYERFRLLQAYYVRAVEYVQQNLAAGGMREPPEGAPYKDVKAYWAAVESGVQALPVAFWPPAEFEWRYSAEKIEQGFAAGKIGKTKYNKWKKNPNSEFIGDWQCAFCPYRVQCLSVEYPEYAYLLRDLAAPEEEAA